MASVNKVIIIGNLGRDPEMRSMPSGDSICNIAVATSETWKDKNSGEKREQTEWHRVTMFGKLADIAGQYLAKGSQVYLEGKLKTRKYTDSEGVEKYATEIVADEMRMLSKREGGGQDRDEPRQERAPQRQAPQERSSPQRQAQKPAPNFSDMDDDIPFLFNMNTVCDTMGQSKSHMRAKYGKGLSILRVNQGDF